MASDPCLRIKQGLLWDIKKRFPLDNIESPAFTLLNSLWKVMIDIGSVHEKKPNDSTVNILLRNLSDSQLSQSFKVTTFFHDKKTDTHMKFPTVIVSSTYVTLYTISYHALRMKLSNSDMSSGLIVLIFFSASVEPGLEVKRDYSLNIQGSNVEKDYATPKSCLKVVPCLIWESEMPCLQKHQMSPVFYLQYTACKLEIALANPLTGFNSAYQISFKWLGNVSPKKGVEVLTFLNPKGYDVSYRVSTRPDGTYATVNTWHKARFESVKVDASGFRHGNDITIISVLDPIDGLALIREIKIDKFVFLDCSLCQNHGCFIQENRNKVLKEEYSPAQFLHNILSLPEDFSTRAPSPCDVQLEFGETRIFAHKDALASRSTLFKTILGPGAGNLNKNQTIILNPIIRSTLFKIIIGPGAGNLNKNQTIILNPIINKLPLLDLFFKYLYTGRLPDSLSEDLILSFYNASSAYRVEILQQMCRCFFAKNLREDNYLTFMFYAIANRDIELRNAIYLFAIVNPSVMRSESYRTFSGIFPSITNGIYSMYRKYFSIKNSIDK